MQNITSISSVAAPVVVSFIESLGLTPESSRAKNITLLKDNDPDYEAALLGYANDLVIADAAEATRLQAIEDARIEAERIANQGPTVETHETIAAKLNSHNYPATSDFRAWDSVENGEMSGLVAVNAITGEVISRPPNKSGITAASGMFVYAEGEFKGGSAYLPKSDIVGAINRGSAQAVKLVTLLNKKGENPFAYAKVPVLVYNVTVSISGQAAAKPAVKGDYGKVVTVK